MSSFVARWLKISLVVIVGCGFLAMMIYALVNRDEIRSSQIEPPLITPPSEPLKRRPDQPGGMQIPNRDKLVFDLLDSSNTALGATGVGSGEVDEPVAASATTIAELVDAVSGTAAKAIIEPVKVVAAVSTAQVIAQPVAKIVEPKPLEVAKPVVKVEEKPKDVVKAEPKAEEKPVAKTNGKWGVQLAAVNSVADGNVMASKAAKDFVPLKSLTPRVSAVPGGGKYRVQFVGLKDRDAAADVCAKLKGKQGCFPVSVQ